jgi:hypothetical protein
MNWLEALLPDSCREAFLGDLEEEYIERVAANAWLARLWYCKEVIVMIVQSASRWLALALAAGAIAGSALAMFVRGNWRLSPYALMMLLPYSLPIIGLTLLLRRRSGLPFLVRLLVVLTAFMMTNLVTVYAMLVFDPRISLPSLLGLTWRIALLLALGTPVSACAAILSAKRLQTPYPLAVSLGVLGGASLIMSLFGNSFTLLAVVFACLLLATAATLEAVHIDSFSRRLGIAALVCIVAAVLVVGGILLIARRPLPASWWLTYVQWGMLYALIGSVATAAVSRSRPEMPVTD